MGLPVPFGETVHPHGMKLTVIDRDGHTRSFDVREALAGDQTAPLWIILALLAGIVFGLGYTIH
jgi:hypothetical protein